MMAKRNNKEPVPYIILGSREDMDRKFYERYDANFLYNKAITLLHIINQGEEATKQVEEFALSIGSGRLSPKYLESLQAEVFFTALHQCETFFAMLLAIFQPLPHWVYLTTYETGEIKSAIDKIVEGNVGELTNNAIKNIQDFVKAAVYTEFVVSDPELAARWDENIDNVAWIIERIGRFLQEYDRAYNSYKHGLRVMTGPHRLGIAPQSPDGTASGPMRLLQSSDNAATYLQREPVREVDGRKEQPLNEVTKAFSPYEAAFYIAKMQQMLETVRSTRLCRLKPDAEGVSLNTFFRLDKDYVIRLAERSEFVVGPARADEGRAYQQYIEQMRAHEESVTEAGGQENDATLGE